MDSKYLNEIMKEPLAECLAEVCFKKPLDPIEYIALWLYKYDKKIKQDSVDDAEKALLNKMKQEKQKEKERLEKLLLDRLKQEKEMQERQKLTAEMDQVAFAGSTKEEAKEEAQVKLEKKSSSDYMIEIGVNEYDDSSESLY